jgi:hypothetical protein
MPDSPQSRPDLTPHELPREHGQLLSLDAFRRHTEHAFRQHTTPQAQQATDARTADLDAELKHALSLAFTDLGGAAFALAHHGALTDKRLAAHVDRIHELYRQLDALAHTTQVTPPAHASAEQAATA